MSGAVYSLRIFAGAAAVILGHVLAGCSAQADFPDVRATTGVELVPDDYTGAFIMSLDSSAAAEHNSELGVPVDVSLRPSPGDARPVDLDAPADTLQYYHVELFTEDGAISRCTVQEEDDTGAYSESICRRAGEIVQIVVAGSSAGRLIFEVAKPADGAALSGRGFLQHLVLPISPSIGAVTLTRIDN